MLIQQTTSDVPLSVWVTGT